MAVAFFQVQLSVKPKEGGAAELVLPDVLQGLNYQFVMVKEGGEEAIIRLEASTTDLKKMEKENNCQHLTESQMRTLKESYPAPKLKQKYRLRTQSQEGGELETVNQAFAIDEQGNRIVDSLQTVRAGFYLIDVPVLTTENNYG